MMRFLTTLVLTVVGLITASLWWSTQDGARPFPDLSLPTHEEPPAPAAQPTPEAAPTPAAERSSQKAARKAAQTTTPNTPPPQGTDRTSVPRSEPEASEGGPPQGSTSVPRSEPEASEGRPLQGSTSVPRSEPEASEAPTRRVPPVPGLVLPERTRVVSPMPADPGEDAPEPVGETEVPGRRPFVEDEPEPELRGPSAVALRRDPERSAERIRRLLDVYEDLAP